MAHMRRGRVYAYLLGALLWIFAVTLTGVTHAGAVSPTVPVAPNAPTAAAGNDGVQISWTAPANGGDPITSFDIEPFIGSDAQTVSNFPVGIVGSSLDPTPGASDNATVTNLTPGDTYTFEVRANNDIGNGTWSAASTSVVAPTPSTTVTASPSQIDFGGITLGDTGDTRTITLTNTGANTATIASIDLNGADQDDFISGSDPGTCDTTILPGGTCTITAVFIPGALGDRSATLTVSGNWSPSTNIYFSGEGEEGYYIAGADGTVDNFGDAQWYGDLSNLTLNAPIAGMAVTGDNGGYWLATANGGVFPFGDARFYGSPGNLRLNNPIVGMAATPDGGGYWLVASDGGIFTFGDAQYFGSTGAIKLNKPIVGMATTPDGQGYWLVASDGGIFAFGDAPFYGSTGAIRLNQPINGMQPTADGGGYWLVASDGGIFSFGDAVFHGSTGAIHLNRPIVGMAPSPDGNGYWLVASDGGIFTFGDAQYLGSDAATGIDAVGMAIDGQYTLQSYLNIPAIRGFHPSVRSYQR